MKRLIAVLTGLALLLISGNVFAAGGMVNGPNVVAPDRYVYYPGTEVLAKDEVRVEHSKKYKLQEQDWRKAKPWYKPSK